MKRYKLTTQALTTYNNHQWVVGQKQTIDEALGTTLCSADVFHFYDSPLAAELLNSAHAAIRNPRLWEVQIDAVAAHDGAKGGCKSMTLVREVVLPVISREARVRFAILCALEVYTTPTFVKWAEAWLDGTDRSQSSAYAAAASSSSAAAAAYAAAYAADAASAASAAADASSSSAASASAKSKTWPPGKLTNLAKQAIRDEAAFAKNG